MEREDPQRHVSMSGRFWPQCERVGMSARTANAPCGRCAAAVEKINASYVSGILRLTLLAPKVVGAIVDGRQPEGMMLPGLVAGATAEWGGQHGAMLGDVLPGVSFPLTADKRSTSIVAG